MSVTGGNGIELDWNDLMVDAFEAPPQDLPDMSGPWFDIPLDDPPPLPTPKQIFPAATNYSSKVNLIAARERLETMRNPTGSIEKLLTFNPSKLKLTKTDEAAIDDWVRGGWSALNEYARGLMVGKTEEEIQLAEKVTGSKSGADLGSFTDRLANVIEAMQKLPEHQGKSYRRVDPKYGIESYARKIRPGDYVTDMGFSASSVFRGSEGAGGGWGKPGGLYFDIEGRTGRNITPYSQIGGEAEVLFLPGTSFHVDAIEVEGNQTVWVLLTEAAPPRDVPVKNAFTGDPF
jgi:hypothetical protein